MTKTNYEIPALPLSDTVLGIERFTPDDIAVVTYPTPDSRLNRWFEAWTHEKTPGRDLELGTGVLGTLDWVFQQSGSAGGFRIGGLYQLFLFLYKPTGELLACAGVVPEDRFTLKKYGLVANGLWGYFNVDHRLRGKGIGRIICNYVDGRVHAYAEDHNIPLTFYLFSGNDNALRIYSELGWTSTGQQVTVADFEGVAELPDDETLMVKIYHPGSGFSDARIKLEGYQCEAIGV